MVQMIPKYVFNTLLLFRSASLSCKVNSSFKKHKWKEFKLFHCSSISLNRNKYEIKKVKRQNTTELVNSREVKVWKNMTIGDIALAMKIPTSQLGLLLPHLNVNSNTLIQNFDIFNPVADKLNIKLKIVKNPNEISQETKNKDNNIQQPSKPDNLVKRPPVVTIMGHVDHGKTTLLDSLRNTFVAQNEFGGITQHIGAFSVEVRPGQRITFIDTPGHAAFSSMRSRGVEVTDIVVLVIAADDGIMEQTIESINVARAAQVRIIVAVNKIDKVNAKTLEEVKEGLLMEGIQVEDKGGDIQLVPISALKKINLDLLTETILLEAEALDLKGDPTGMVEGVIIESKREKIGILATVIVKKGTLRKKKMIVAGKAHARVRRMLDENGKDCEEAFPSTPVQVFGWKELPLAGDEVIEVKSEREATKIINDNLKKILKEKQETDKIVIQKKASEHQEKFHEYKKALLSLKDSRERRKYYFEIQKRTESERNNIPSIPDLKVILKGDVFGTLEVLVNILGSYDKNDECKLSVVDASVGDIKPKDVETAEFFEALIYAFNVNLHDTAKELVKEKNVDVRYHNVIYKLIDDLKEELSARIPDKEEEKLNGEAEVIQNFFITYASKKIPVAGARCYKGQLNKESLYKVLRNGEVIFEGKLKVMKNLKKDVKIILKGMECGLMLDSFPDKFEPGDRIICYDMVKVSRGTTWDPGF